MSCLPVEEICLRICLREHSWRRVGQLRIWKEGREPALAPLELRCIRFRPNCRLLPVRHRLLWRFRPAISLSVRWQRRQKSQWKSSQDKKRADLCVSRREMAATGPFRRRKSAFCPLQSVYGMAAPTLLRRESSEGDGLCILQCVCRSAPRAECHDSQSTSRFPAHRTGRTGCLLSPVGLLESEQTDPA